MIPYPLELFQSTLSLRRATPGGWAGWVHGLISIHALLAESDAFSPLGALFLDISIHALLAESDGEPAGGGGHHGISIHALLAESDFGGVRTYLDNIISIHALLAESDVIRNFPPRAARGFQSTLSLRRATATGAPHTLTAQISIHALLAESDYCAPPTGEDPVLISIHALLAESDSGFDVLGSTGSISIHALLAESDSGARAPSSACRNFNPRSPCGERRTGLFPKGERAIFQSTLSLRRATPGDRRGGGRRCISIHALLAESDDEAIGSRLYEMSISIHALLAESDIGSYSRFAGESNFNPRSPCGERPGQVLTKTSTGEISIHALLAESDHGPGHHVGGIVPIQSTLSLRRATPAYKTWSTKPSPCGERPRPRPPRWRHRPDFNPRSPCGERLANNLKQAAATHFNPRSPCGERPVTVTKTTSPEGFQSTLSLRRATDCGTDFTFSCIISIHALLAESDPEPVPLDPLYT